MNKPMIAVVLVTALCISMAAPMDADAAAVLVALPVVWAVAAVTGVTVAVVDNYDESTQTQQAANTSSEPSSNESPPTMISAEAETMRSEVAYEMTPR